ncbi:restriction endonuclease subunit S [Nitrosomonas sp. Nm33]|uniref:restriction endonuclease subunit S n=1 Tax=Nitrosomonas sp. Nm33 TaxID=133724 RepID=UPI0008957E8A|nr:restriction endonuclease subunit S [Nitrosomonas sp. Nm33]SDY75260.1 Type I restriction modification DNA specificity domain-containing protein [Nitrosomonas sp. Nm33]
MCIIDYEVIIVRLKQIATVSSGYPFRGKISEVADSNVVVVQMKDVSLQEGIHWASCLTTELTGKRAPGWLQPGDILVAARGSHNYAIPVDESLLRAGTEAVAAPHFFVVSIMHKTVLPQYLAWLLNQNPCQRYFEQNAEGTLTKSIRRSVLENAPVAVPPLAKQQAIINLANAIKQERQIMEQLLRNHEHLLNTIARDLLANQSPKPTQN